MTLAIKISLTTCTFAFLLFFICCISSDAIEFKSYKLQRFHNHRSTRRAQISPNSLDASWNSEEQLTQIIPFNSSDSRSSSKLEETNETTAGTEHRRRRRRRKRSTFAWPPSSIFISQFSLQVPLYSPDGLGIPFLLEVPYEFDLPNITNSIVKRRSVQDRYSFYGTVESLFSRFGYDGRACLLRAVCERAESELITEGLLGEVLNLFLAVSMSAEPNSDLLWEYNDAENYGKALGDCTDRFKKCPLSIFHLFD